mmetsp:Transcript_17325/g.31377  ORF Transcript_17325/g.31377 Transcript_17325/m.31377 type:complete len:226 (-) Transcript_17325:286-963(-)
MIHPSIANLFTDTTGKFLSKIGPASKWLLGRGRDSFHDNCVFVISPLSLANTRFEISNPTLVTFFCSLVESVFFGNRLPVFRILKPFHDLCQVVVLFLGPTINTASCSLGSYTITFATIRRHDIYSLRRRTSQLRMLRSDKLWRWLKTSYPSWWRGSSGTFFRLISHHCASRICSSNIPVLSNLSRLIGGSTWMGWLSRSRRGCCSPGWSVRRKRGSVSFLLVLT